MKKILEKLTIYGWDEYILTAGLIGFPVLLWGDPGSGKTRNIKILLESLEYKTIYHDASKAQWEDLLGFPIPDTNTRKIELYPSQTSLLDKEAWIIDEINRAPIYIQNWLLEIIREKSILGIKTTINCIFAACNILEAGTGEMDRALLSRFIGTKVPDFLELDENTGKNIIRNIIDGNEIEIDKETKIELKNIVDNIRKLYNINLTKNEIIDQLTDFLYKFGKILKTSDTRKLLTLKKLIILYNTINSYLKQNLDEETILEKAVLHTYGPFMFQNIYTKETLLGAVHGAKNILNKEFKKYFSNNLLDSVLKDDIDNAILALENLEELRKTDEGIILTLLIKQFPELSKKLNIKDISILEEYVKSLNWNIKNIPENIDLNDPLNATTLGFLWAKDMDYSLFDSCKKKIKNIYEFILKNY